MDIKQWFSIMANFAFQETFLYCEDLGSAPGIYLVGAKDVVKHPIIHSSPQQKIKSKMSIVPLLRNSNVKTSLISMIEN